MHVLKRLVIPLGLVGLLMAAQSASAQIDTSTDEGQIRQLLREVRLAHAADDIDGVMRHYWNDARLVIMDPDDDFKIEGWNTWKQYLEDRRAVQKTLIWRTRHRKNRVRGDNCIATFYVTRQVQMGSRVFQKHERGTYILKKMDGRWQIVAQHISAMPPIELFQYRSYEDPGRGGVGR